MVRSFHAESDPSNDPLYSNKFYTLMIQRRFEDGADFIGNILGKVNTPKEALALRKLMISCLYRAESFSAIRAVIAHMGKLGHEDFSLLWDQTTIETCKFEDLEDSNTSLNRALPLRILGRILKLQFSEATDLVSRSELDYVVRGIVNSLVHFMQGRFHEAKASNPGNSEFNQSLFEFLCRNSKESSATGFTFPQNEEDDEHTKYGQLHSCITGLLTDNPTETALINSHLWKDSADLGSIMEETLTRIESPSSLEELNMRDFLVCNILIVYVREGQLSKASKLLASCGDLRRLERCFIDKVEWLRLRLFIEINSEALGRKAVKEIETLLGACDSAETQYGLADILGKFLYDSDRFEELEVLGAKFSRSTPLSLVNTGHMYFVQEKHVEAIKYYQKAIDAVGDSVLDLKPVVFANLCVSLLVVDRNNEAESVFGRIHEAEAVSCTSLHSCTINLVIGNLYCSQCNYEFGIQRMIDAFGSDLSKLAGETWSYTKAVLVSLAAAQTQGTGPIISDTVLESVFEFLVKVESVERFVPSDETELSVQQEAKHIYSLLVRIFHE